MNAFETFAALIAPRREGTLPLLTALAWLPRYADAGFDPDAVIACVQRWRELLRERVAADTSTLNRLRLLNHFFFDKLGFHGDPDAYDSAQASYLYRVLEQRRGMPISLAVLYAEIGRGIGLKLAGVAFPGHFIVRLQLAQRALFRAAAFRLTAHTCVSIFSAPLTSYLPGASTFSAFTTPSSTSIEKRWQRTPMPRAVRSSSRPSFFV